MLLYSTVVQWEKYAPTNKIVICISLWFRSPSNLNRGTAEWPARLRAITASNYAVSIFTARDTQLHTLYCIHSVTKYTRFELVLVLVCTDNEGQWEGILIDWPAFNQRICSKRFDYIDLMRLVYLSTITKISLIFKIDIRNNLTNIHAKQYRNMAARYRCRRHAELNSQASTSSDQNELERATSETTVQ